MWIGKFYICQLSTVMCRSLNFAFTKKRQEIEKLVSDFRFYVTWCVTEHKFVLSPVFLSVKLEWSCLTFWFVARTSLDLYLQ